MDDLVAFLTARLDEDEADARNACPPRRPVSSGEAWAVESSDAHEPMSDGGIPAAVWVVTGPEGEDGIAAVNNHHRAVHIARHDPARVLAEVAAKRRMIGYYVVTTRLCAEAKQRIDTAESAGREANKRDYADWDRANTEASILADPVRLLALPYADHPDYRRE